MTLFLAIPLFFSIVAVAYHLGQQNVRQTHVAEYLIGDRVVAAILAASEQSVLEPLGPFRVVLVFEHGMVQGVAILVHKTEAEPDEPAS